MDMIVFIIAIRQLASVALEGVLIAWRRGVDEFLDKGCIGDGNRSHYEAPEYPRDRLELDSKSSKPGIDQSVEDRNEDDDGDRIDVAHDVIGDAMELHRACLRNKVVEHLRERGPVNDEERESLAG